MDGQLTAGESSPYTDGQSTFTAADGDELWITGEGAIVPSENPDYDSQSTANTALISARTRRRAKSR